MQDIRDYSDADLERLYSQWEEDDEPIPPDELPDGEEGGGRGLKGRELWSCKLYNLKRSHVSHNGTNDIFRNSQFPTCTLGKKYPDSALYLRKNLTD